MQKYFYIFLFIIGIIASALTSVNAQWEGWNYRRTVTIGNTSGSTLTDYQVKIELNNSMTFPFNFANANSDGSDLRVTSFDKVTEIPFWIETWNVADTQAVIWVKVDSIPVVDTVYLYYGNTVATSVSNGDSTFEFFDDFESWIQTSAAWSDKQLLPTPKADLTCAVYDGKLYAIGGYNNGGSDTRNENYEYDPATNTWATKAAMPTARWGPVAVEFNGKIYVFGGQLSGGGGTSKNEVYDPVANTWDVTKANMPGGLAAQGLMGVKFGDKIHLFYQSAHYEYDPGSDTYLVKTDVPTPRTWSTVGVVGSKIYVIGGFSYGSPGGATNVNEIYDPATNSTLWVAGLTTSDHTERRSTRCTTLH